jgi:hypothetical protein
MKLEDLVVLQYASNTCYTTLTRVSEVKVKNFSVDIEKSTWSYDEYRDRKIGDARLYGAHFGVIGVYDRTNDQHLNSMLYAARDHKKTMNYFFGFSRQVDSFRTSTSSNILNG